MTLLKLTLRSLFYYRRAHTLVLAGTLLASAILVGAMLVGDSIKFSLIQSALLRLGNIQCSLETCGRFFTADLATRLSNETGAEVSPALLFRGIALSQKNEGAESRQINNVQILGVDDSFWGLAPGPKPTLSHEGIAINQKLAYELQLHRGDPISIRFSKPSLMSRDAPLSSQDKSDTRRGTFIVETIIEDNQLGRFSLNAQPQVPCTAFVSLSWLQHSAGLNHQANLILAGGSTTPSAEHLNRAMRKVWQLADAGLTFKPISGTQLFQLECDRIFMDPSIGAALSNITKSVGALTYLVNSIARTNGNPVLETPYSFVIALAPSADSTVGLVPPKMTDDEIIVNRWLANQLTASPGDVVRISYYEFRGLNQFIETNRLFKIRGIVEMSAISRERELGPNFPGLTDAGKCVEWDIGMPLKKDKISDPANESYWNDYRATPKALITLKAGQEMWANPFGNLTAIRFHPHDDEEGRVITKSVLQCLNPAEIGLTFLPIRQIALKAANEAMDFGQLFTGMSFFLIVASLMLTGLLFAFGIQQRSEETGLLLAAGYQARQIRRLWINEGILIAMAGTLGGALLGSLFTRSMIWGLSHYWQGAFAHTEIQFHATFATIAVGALLSFAFTMGALLLTVKRQTTKSVRELFTGELTVSPAPRLGWLSGVAALGLISAVGLIGYAASGKPHNLAIIFFTAGSLLLISLLVFTRLLLNRLARPGGHLTPLTLGLRNVGRQSSRSLTAASLLACGCFLIIAVSAMQEDISRDALRRDSGTGGFALFGTSTLPIQADLNSPEWRSQFNLAPFPDLKVTSIVSMKVRDGDDASCLNLNRAQSPTLIGVDPADFLKRGAFQVIKSSEPLWALLDESLPDGVIPGLVGDANTAQWGIKKNTGRAHGDILEFFDERGKTFRVKLMGSLPMNVSVFQGSILISSRAFVAHYPSENGSRMFLVDSLPGAEHLVQTALITKFRKWGLSLTPSIDRLKSFYAVESSYMAMFLVLGGLGMLLGSAGMTIVILRNIQERRAELALLSATGYAPHQILKVILAEYVVILGIGLAIGLTASVAAIWPSLQAPGGHLPWIPVIGLITGMLFFQIIWILLAVWMALRAPLLDALRNQ